MAVTLFNCAMAALLGFAILRIAMRIRFRIGIGIGVGILCAAAVRALHLLPQWLAVHGF
ncbi:MAG: hypothetical protein E7K72_22800 [Roseomonas mucosa]|nr:hypothetical protein [Roseomonas mucosa]